MSGHSKWAQIKRQKGVADQKKGAVFSKLAKAIAVAAKHGGGEPEKNFTLRVAVEKARAANMPKDNIERAIKKGSGDGEGTQIEEMIYEGYGPGGVAIMIEAATDNRNRTTSEIRHLLSEYDGNLGSSGAVQWMFRRRGMITIENAANPEEVELAAIDTGAEDVDTDETSILIYTIPENLLSIKDTLASKNIAIAHAEIEWVADTTTSLAPEDQKKLEALMEALSSHDDVTNYYTNAD